MDAEDFSWTRWQQAHHGCRGLLMDSMAASTSWMQRTSHGLDGSKHIMDAEDFSWTRWQQAHHGCRGLLMDSMAANTSIVHVFVCVCVWQMRQEDAAKRMSTLGMAAEGFPWNRWQSNQGADILGNCGKLKSKWATNVQ
eukprot:EG_transcript_27283